MAVVTLADDICEFLAHHAPTGKPDSKKAAMNPTALALLNFDPEKMQTVVAACQVELEKGIALSALN